MTVAKPTAYPGWITVDGKPRVWVNDEALADLILSCPRKSAYIYDPAKLRLVYEGIPLEYDPTFENLDNLDKTP